MNKKEMKGEIWNSLLVMALNFSDFDAPKYGELRHGLVDDEWDDTYFKTIEPRTTKAHQKRFDIALEEIIEFLEKKVSK